MYNQFYGFKEKLFQLTPSIPAFLFKIQKHIKTLTYVEYAIKERVGFILLPVRSDRAKRR